MRPPAPSLSAKPWPGIAPVAGLLAVSLGLRLLLAALLPAGVDEAYSIGVARQVALSYFDHPPLHLWLVGLWTRLVGSEAIFVARLPFVLLGTVSGALLYRLTARLFSPAAGIWALALFCLAPIFGLAHQSFVLPDGPLLAASLMLGNLLVPMVLDEERGASLGRWGLAGVAAGLALLSKYHGVLLILGVLVFLASSPARRRLLATPGPWLAAAVAGVLFLPVLVWNGQHGWVSFGFQAGRGAGGGLRPFGPIEALAQQAAYLLPWIALPAGWGLWRALRRGPADAGPWFLACLALPPIVLFTLLAFTARGLPHWPMPGWLLALPLGGAWLAEASPRLRRWARRIGIGTAIAEVALVGLLLAQLHLRLLASLFGDKGPTDALVSWQPVASEIETRAKDLGGRSFVAATDWITAGELNYALGGRLPVLCLCTDARHFAFLADPADYTGWSGLVVTPPGKAEKAGVGARFAVLGPAESVGIVKGGHIAIPLDLRVGSGFSP